MGAENTYLREPRLMDMWSEEEYFGEPKLIGICANCGEELYLGDEDVVRDSYGDLFCCDTCALDYYSISKYEGEE